jgi:predicted metallopeptidase
MKQVHSFGSASEAIAMIWTSRAAFALLLVEFAGFNQSLI